MHSRPLISPLIAMVVLALLLAACSLPSASPAAPPPPPPREPGGPPPGQPPGGNSALQITFTADRAQINPGECVTLKWQVSGPHFAVLLEGEQVPDQGSKQVCPPESHTFFLQVNTGDHMEERSVQIQVGAGGAPPPPPSGGASPPPPPSSPPPPPTSAPPPPPSGSAATATPTNCGPAGSDCTMSFDLKATKIYAVHLTEPSQAVYLTVTNLGPSDLPKEATIGVTCSASGTSWGGASFGTDYFDSTQMTKVALAAGKSTDIDTGLGSSMDVVQYQYQITCKVSITDGMWSDPNPGNDSLTATIPDH